METYFNIISKITAKSIICQLRPDFDTHDFIEMLSKDFEREYFEILQKEYDKGSKHIFESAHACSANTCPQKQLILN